MAINNQANVNYTYTGARSPVSSNSNITTAEILSASSLSIDKFSLGGNYVPGNNISYIIRIENTGNTPVNEVVLSDNLGQINTGELQVNLLEYVEGTASFSLNDSPFLDISLTGTNPLVLNIGTLQPGDVYEFAYTARAIQGTGYESITNTSTVIGTFGGETISDSDSVTVTALDYANLNITKSQSSDNPILGEDFSYTINLSNDGNIEATNITVTDTLPEEFSLESVDMIQNGITTTLDPSDYSYTGNELTIPSSTSTLDLSVPAGGSLIFVLNGRFTTLETIEP